ncbi:MAG: hypothetical protein MJ175_11430, partial [Clostridia bacterium]|nr:hypothetical protein [Clostridia bacterium]
KIYEEEGLEAYEAYQIALHAPFETHLQKICVKASDDALAEEDYETAFAYAVLAPEPFGAAILNSAALAAFDEETQTIREDAYAAAQYSDDPLIRQLLLRDVIAEARAKHHFVTAMRTAFSLDEGTESVQMVSDILNEALHYFLDRDDYPSVAAYIHMFSQPLSRYDLALDDVQTMIYKHCVKNNDKNTVFFFAKQFKMDTSSLKIEPGDPVIRNDLDGSYFLLTESQMRSYHTRPIDVFNGLYVVENGTVSYSANGTDVSANGVTSVATNAFCTVFLKNNGTISVIANSIVGSNMTAVQANARAMIAGTSKMKNVVSVAAGEEHIVCLHADGTVSAFGDNTYGQCGTKKWKNIVAIAAGKRFTVGLCADGTLVACGSNKCGQCDVSEYRNVTDIAACNQTTVMRFSDGTIHIQGEGSMGLADANRLSDINRIRAGATAILAEKNDGTLTLCGTGITGNYGNVSSWKNVKDFAVGDLCLACINANGKTVTVGSTRVK